MVTTNPQTFDFQIAVTCYVGQLAPNDYGVLVAMLIEQKHVAAFRCDRHQLRVEMIVPSEDVSIQTVQDAARKILEEIEAFVEVVRANR